MDPIRYRIQQTAAEAAQGQTPVPRHARALLEHVVQRARAEQRALKALHETHTPKHLLDLTPTRAVGVLLGHYDDVDQAQDEELAKLDRLILGVSVLARLSKKFGLSPGEVRDLDVHTIARHVPLEVAMAAKDAFYNPDVRQIAEGHAADGAFTWERGETYADPDHLTSTVEELGLRMQARVTNARDFYKRGGMGKTGEVILTGLDVMDDVRAGVSHVIDTASSYYATSSGGLGFAGAIATTAGGAIVDAALSPATAVSENVTPEAQGTALLEVIAALAPTGARAEKRVRKMLKTRPHNVVPTKLVRVDRAATQIVKVVPRRPKKMAPPRAASITELEIEVPKRASTATKTMPQKSAPAKVTKPIKSKPPKPKVMQPAPQPPKPKTYSINTDYEPPPPRPHQSPTADEFQNPFVGLPIRPRTPLPETTEMKWLKDELWRIYRFANRA